MTLYQAIVNYEKKREEAQLEHAARMHPIMKVSPDQRDEMIKGKVAATWFILDAIHNNRNDPLPEEELNRLVYKITPRHEDSTIIAEMVPASRESINTLVEFYRQILAQEGNAESFEEAARRQFENADRYREALAPIARAEAIFYEMLEGVYPANAIVSEILVRAAREVRKREIQIIFSKDKISLDELIKS